MYPKGICSASLHGHPHPAAAARPPRGLPLGVGRPPYEKTGRFPIGYKKRKPYGAFFFSLIQTLGGGDKQTMDTLRECFVAGIGQLGIGFQQFLRCRLRFVQCANIALEIGKF